MFICFTNILCLIGVIRNGSSFNIFFLEFLQSYDPILVILISIFIFSNIKSSKIKKIIINALNEATNRKIWKIFPKILSQLLLPFWQLTLLFQKGHTMKDWQKIQNCYLIQEIIFWRMIIFYLIELLSSKNGVIKQHLKRNRIMLILREKNTICTIINL